MIDRVPDSHLLPGSAFAPPPAPPPSRAVEISFGQILNVLRRRYRLVLSMIVIGVATGAFLASREPPKYEAKASFRVAGERRALTGGMEGPAPELGRTSDLILSLMQFVRSRNVLGAVVDSIGLQVQSQTPEFFISELSRVKVDPEIVVDSIVLEFAGDGVTARSGTHEAKGSYGQVLSLGGTQFAVTRKPANAERAVLSVTTREMAIDHLVELLLVNGRIDTDFIDVAFVSEDPRLAQQVVNRAVQIFQDANVQTARDKSRRRRVVLEEHLAQTDSTLMRAQTELAGFRRRLQLGSSQGKLTAEQNQMLALDERQMQLATDRRSLGAVVERLRGSNVADRKDAVRSLFSTPALRDNPEFDALYRRLTESQYRLDSLTTGRWAAPETNPDVISLRTQIQNTQSELSQAANAHLKSIDANMDVLSQLRRSSGQSIEILPGLVEEESRLDSRVRSLDQVSAQLREEFQKARMAEAVEAGDVEIVDLAPVPYTPVANTFLVKIVLGFVLGLLLGGCVAFLLEAMNTSIRRPEDIESVLHVPGLAIIPRLTGASSSTPARWRGLGKGGKPAALPKSGAAAIGTAVEPFSVGIEAFRMLRTSLIWSDGAERLKTLVVTSAAPGEGKTLTSANLAVSFSHDGLRVLLVDCDVRRPKLHGLFRVPRSPGLLDLLAPPNGANGDPSVGSLSFHEGMLDGGESALDHALRPTSIRGLTLLTCGSLPTNPSNLLSGIRMQWLLKEFKQRFDVVILDTPPILATADAGILGSLVDGVLLVVRAGQTDRGAAQRAHQQLSNVGARVVGAVLNDPQGELSQFGDFYYPYEYAPERE